MAHLTQVHSIRTLKLGYVLALSFTAILTVVTWLMVHKIILTQAYSAAQVNVSGKQRMLSQEIAFLSAQLVNPAEEADRQITRQKLLDAIEQMKRNHQGLIHGSSSLNLPDSPMSETIRAMYFEKPIALEHQIERYLAEGEALIQTPDFLLDLNNPHLRYLMEERIRFRDSLNQMVNQYQIESEQEIQRLQVLEKEILSVTLLVLFLEALFIFRPLVNTVQREQRVLKEMNVELHNLSSLDGLTHIANRRVFDQFIEKEWHHSLTNSVPFAMILCDIDHFKAYNDTYGHQQGDECLRQVAQALKDTVKRKEDLVARYGGEEFAIVLSSTDEAGAKSVAEAVKKAIFSLQIPHKASMAAPFVTISLGVACATFSKEHSATDGSLELLIKTADDALYQAKAFGRNQIVMKVPSYQNL